MEGCLGLFRLRASLTPAIRQLAYLLLKMRRRGVEVTLARLP